MDQGEAAGGTDMQEQIDDLRSRVDAAEERADASEARADKAELRADDSANRADAAQSRSDEQQALSEYDRARIAAAEGRLDVHDELIAELQAEGLITSQHAAHLDVALKTARTIGAAVGIVMALHHASEVEAFALLRKASNDGNRKLRLVAEEVVLTGDVNQLR
jgi:hypothetical protein